MTNTTQLSDCCKAFAKIVYGHNFKECDCDPKCPTPTLWFQCVACQKPCDVFVEEKGEKRNDYTKMVAEQIGYLVGVFDTQNSGVDNINPTKEILETASRLNYIVQEASQEAYKKGYIQGGLDSDKSLKNNI